MDKITRVARKRRCRCNQNINKFSCGHGEVAEVYWVVDGVRFYTLKAAKKAAESHDGDQDKQDD